MKLYNNRFHNAMEFDMALQPVAFWMLRKGIRFDTERRAQLQEEYIGNWKKLQTQLDSIVGHPLNVNSPKQMKEFIVEMGIKLRSKKGKTTADEDALRAIMAECEDKLRKASRGDTKERWLRAYLAIKVVLKIKTIRKRLSSYINMEIDTDGRVRCSETVGGAETARWAHSSTPWDTGTNLATIPRDLRILFRADDGKELAEFDLNRGESWVYSFLSLDPELLRIHTTNGDFHSETASAISTAFSDKHYSVDEIIELYEAGGDFGYKIRYLGKKVNHASAYQMGPFRGAEVVNSEADDTNITVTPSQFKKAQNLWKEKYFMMPQWWRDIETKMKKDRTLTTPWGRTRTFYGFMGEELYKEATAYVPQSTSVDYLNLGMLDVFNEMVLKGKCDLLHQNHDSILIQYNEQDRDEVIPQVIEHLTNKLVINNREFSIPVEGSYGQNWKDLKKWKAPKLTSESTLSV